jgi:hypothetical protein
MWVHVGADVRIMNCIVSEYIPKARMLMDHMPQDTVSVFSSHLLQE